MATEERKKEKKKKQQSVLEKELYAFIYAIARKTIQDAIDDVLSVMNK